MIFIQRQLLPAGYPRCSQPGKPSLWERLLEGWLGFEDSSYVILYLGLLTPPCWGGGGGIKKQGKKVTGRAVIKLDLQLIGNISELLEEKQPTALAFATPGREELLLTPPFLFIPCPPFALRKRSAITEMKDSQGLHQVGGKYTSSRATSIYKPG